MPKKKTQKIVKPTFDECLPTIDKQILKHRKQWRLSSIAWMDYDDVAQRLRIHIWNKWEHWNHKRPLEPWLTTVISNQIRNMIRNEYSNFSRPCLRCHANQGDNLCGITKSGKQCSECPLYKTWERTKKAALDVKLPVSIDSDKDEENPIRIQIESQPHSFVNYEEALRRIDEKMKLVLKPIEYQVYTYLYLEGHSEEEVAKLMDYKTSEKGRTPGYKWINKIKKTILDNARIICKEIVE